MGKASVLIDGQFGSTGKGLLAAYLAARAERPPDIVTTNASANAGHTTVFADGSKMVLYHLPTAGVLTRHAFIYLNAGAVIHPLTLALEISSWDKRYNLRNRLAISPRAAIIEPIDEANSSIGLSGGTGHGVSGAIARKVKRENPLVGSSSDLHQFVREGVLMARMHYQASVLIETPQGISLGLNSGLEYPKCTSREVSVSQSLADAGIHPSFLGKVFLSLRTYPIRVGNPILEGETVSSGGWYPDQKELSWEELGVEPEITTVTKRQRRIATFSRLQAGHALAIARPDVIFLNFVEYGPPAVVREIVEFLQDASSTLHLTPRLLYGFGPRHDVHVTDELEVALAR
jgi:adenylosuccinate synthase